MYLTSSIQYIGEHLWLGRIGHFAIIISFVAALLTIYAGWQRHKERPHWEGIIKGAFSVHAISIFVTIATLFYVVINRYYEYRYAFAHSSDDLPFKYIFSAFWEDQEGSFLLWMFWHAVLGLIIIWSKSVWKYSVVFFLALIQAFLCSMLLGIQIPFLEDTQLGVSPFVLLRHTMDAPIFQNASYLTLIEGQGLNPLLQNYWNVIHPPTLFLGFASTSIPFCFAMSGLWEGKYKAWLKPALPWALFSMMILGTGLLMGSFWAYEALNFGGYWAWDPVENASLVPWILGVAAIHTHLIARNTGRAIKMTVGLYALTFIGILYSTFLTRSGVLEDTSVHAFTELGLETQLSAFILFFIGLSIFFLIWRRKAIPNVKSEERSSSREFWMILGVFTFILSTILISFTTSIPLINKLMDAVGWIVGSDFTHLHRSAPIDAVAHYNKFQLWIAVFIIILSSTAQALRWKQLFWQSNNKIFFKEIGLAIAAGVLAYFISSKTFTGYSWQYHVLLGAAWFGLAANVFHLFWTKEKRQHITAIIAHAGFAIMVLGILWSGLKQHYVSTNPFFQRGLIPTENLDRNVLLYKGTPLDIPGYNVTYLDDTLDDLTRTFRIQYDVKNREGEITESFISTPNVLYTKAMDKIAAPNPSTKHYLTYDVFSHIASLPTIEVDPLARQALEDTLSYDRYTIQKGERLFTKNYAIDVIDIKNTISQDRYSKEPNDLALGTTLAILDADGKAIDTIYPGSLIRGNIIYRFPDKSNKARLQIRLPDDTMEALLSEQTSADSDLLSLKMGEDKIWKNFRVSFLGFSQDVQHPQYQRVEGDIVVAAEISLTDISTGQTTAQRPIYLIRGARPSSFADIDAVTGLRSEITTIDPVQKEIVLSLSQSKFIPDELDIEIAGEVPRDDFIVLESIIFPGINMFWLGTIMMLIALGISMKRSYHSGT